MNELSLSPLERQLLATGEKFSNPDITANGEQRAKVPLHKLETLWINTGSLCNIECSHCYILSSPKNDDLVYFKTCELIPFLDEIDTLNLGTGEIGFTGGEPFLNPEMGEMLESVLSRKFNALVLTNAMLPMQRPRVKKKLLELNQHYPSQLTLRISLDHYSERLHDEERGKGSFSKTLEGIDWLTQNGFQVTIAGRSLWGGNEETDRQKYGALFEERDWPINSQDPVQLVIFPEMDEQADTPEITESCWHLLGLTPNNIMCSTSRMIIKRKGAAQPAVLPCTLIAYRPDFEMGATLNASLKATSAMFDQGAVKLCHPHCSKFCVLGGGSCSTHK